MWKMLRRSVAFWIIVTEVVIVAVCWTAGFRITYSPDIAYNWTAIGAIGEWAALFVGLLIPIAAVYFEHRLQSNRRDISDSNIQLLSEFKEYKIQSEAKFEVLSQMLSELGATLRQPPVPPEKSEKDKYNDLKEDALKFVNISMAAHSSQVAKHLGIDVKYAWEILRDLCMNERKITSGGPITENDYDRNIWLKKKQ